MTKPFRVEEKVAEATRHLRAAEAWPPGFYELLRARHVEPLESVMIHAIPDQGCFCIKLIDQNRRVVSFDLEFEGSIFESPSVTHARIVDWEARETEGEEWWWKEHSRMTAPKPNNPIFVGLKMLDQ